MEKTINIYAGKELARYGFPGGHPFSTHRFKAFWDEFIKRKLDKRPEIRICPAVLANDTDIQLFQDKDYIEQVKHQSITGTGYLDFGDTPAFPGVYDAAAYVVGTALQACNDIITEACQQAFVPIAGLHHAHRDQASGFCVFNDCSAVIVSLLQRHQLSRIAYVDIDAHHGDGVYYAFESDPRVIYADLHEDGRFLFPGTGANTECGKGKATGLKLNIPMPQFADDASFYNKFEQVLSFISKHKPEFIILQCGVDSMAGDPLTHLQYSSQAHRHATTKLKQLASNLGHNRLLCLGGGGYNLNNIANGWCAVIEALLST